jgi:hypothetical protein
MSAGHTGIGPSPLVLPSGVEFRILGWLRQPARDGLRPPRQHEDGSEREEAAVKITRTTHATYGHGLF